MPAQDEKHCKTCHCDEGEYAEWFYSGDQELGGPDHLISLCPELVTIPFEKKTFNGNHSYGSFDLYYPPTQARIEVKVGRMKKGYNGKKKRVPALSTDSTVMCTIHCIKPEKFDAAIILFVWLDKIRYFMVPPDQFKKGVFPISLRKYAQGFDFSPSNTNIDTLKEYEFFPEELEERIQAIKPLPDRFIKVVPSVAKDFTPSPTPVQASVTEAQQDSFPQHPQA